MKDRIRRIVKDSGGIALPLEEIGDTTDLYRAGMTSYNSVVLMIALESEFGMEFPDGMLNRDIFQNIDAIANAIETVTQVQQ